MSDRTCSIEGCERKYYAFSYCRMHYRRWRATGDPGPVDPIRNVDRNGCTVDGCDKPHKGKGYCRLHYQRWVKTGDPLVKLPPVNPINWGPSNGNWKSGEVAYITMHQRIIRSRGKATDQTCAKCDGSASQWAYDYSDPNALRDKRGCPYSTDPGHYMPLCASCHKRFDLAQSEVAHGQHR